MLPPAFKMRLSKHPPSESNICTQNRPFPPGVLPLLAPISSQEARSSHAFCFWLPHGYYKYIYIQYILYICMIYMFVYCSTCLQSPSSATTPRSDSLEGDRSPSVKKNGSLNSEWCLEEQFNAELLAEKHRLYCWIHWKKQILSKLHLWTYEHAKPIVDVTSQDWIGSFCDDHLSVFNAIVTGQYATLNMESYFNSGRVPCYIQVGVNPT